MTLVDEVAKPRDGIVQKAHAAIRGATSYDEMILTTSLCTKMSCARH
jgi:hypothetical protein